MRSFWSYPRGYQILHAGQMLHAIYGPFMITNDL